MIMNGLLMVDVVTGNTLPGSGMLSISLLAAAVIISLIAHELAHMALVQAFGGRAGGFRLGIFGATAWVRGLERFKPWQRYAVYLAGLATNALIAVGAWGAARFFCMPLWMTAPRYNIGDYCYHSIWPALLQNIFLYNVVLCVFNLLPVFPLDGGRLMQLFLGNRMGVLRANRVLLKLGPVVGGVLVGLGLVQAVLYPWNVTLLCAGVYIRRKNKELPTVLYWECLQMLQAKNRDRLPVRNINLPKHMTVKRAVEYLGWDYWAVIHIGGWSVSEDELMEWFCG